MQSITTQSTTESSTVNFARYIYQTWGWRPNDLTFDDGSFYHNTFSGTKALTFRVYLAEDAKLTFRFNPLIFLRAKFDNSCQQKITSAMKDIDGFSFTTCPNRFIEIAFPHPTYDDSFQAIYQHLDIILDIFKAISKKNLEEMKKYDS